MDNALVTLDDFHRAAKVLAPVFRLSEPEAVAIMLIGQSDGIHPVLAIRLYDIIEGKPAPKATTVLTWFQQRGGRVDWIEYTDKRAAGMFSHAELQPEPKLFELTIAEARARNLHMGRNGEKHNWKHHTAAMLRARVVTAAVRMIDPGALNGQHIADELEDADLKQAEVESVRDEGTPAPRHERARKLAEEAERREAEREGAKPAATATAPASATAAAAPAAAPAPSAPPVQASAPAAKPEPTPGEIRQAKANYDEHRKLLDQPKPKTPPLFTPEEEQRNAERKAAAEADRAAAAAPALAPRRSRVEPGQPVTVAHLLDAGKALQALVGNQACTATLSRLCEKHGCGTKNVPGKPPVRVMTLCPDDNRRAYLEDLEEEIRAIEGERAKPAAPAQVEVAHG